MCGSGIRGLKSLKIEVNLVYKHEDWCKKIYTANPN